MPRSKNPTKRKRVFFADAERIRCAHCAKWLTVVEATIDHIVPAAKGGTVALDNVAIACLPCNHDRGKSEFWAYRAWRRGEYGTPRPAGCARARGHTKRLMHGPDLPSGLREWLRWRGKRAKAHE